MANITCDIVTPTKRLFTEECYMVVVPGTEGAMGFLSGHAQTMSTLADGVIRVYSDASTVAHTYAMMGGYVQVTGEKAIVLADRAVLVDEIDSAAVQQKIAEAEEALKAVEGADKVLLEEDLKWARVCAHAVGVESAV